MNEQNKKDWFIQFIFSLFVEEKNNFDSQLD